MAKLSKDEARRHQEALDVLQQDVLSDNGKELVLNQYHEAATNVNTVAGAFFTPLDLAWDHAFEMACKDQPGIRVIDLCAGIGVLSYAIAHRYPNVDITCVEINPEYVAVGKKIVPKANWVCMDVMDLEALRALGRFDYAMSNPPFGRVPTFRNRRPARYRGGEAEYKVIDVAADIAGVGVFILPQESAGFKYSGVQHFSQCPSDKCSVFLEQTGLTLEHGCGIDTSGYGPWKSVKPVVEIVCVDFKARKKTALEIEQERYVQNDLWASA